MLRHVGSHTIAGQAIRPLKIKFYTDEKDL